MMAALAVALGVLQASQPVGAVNAVEVDESLPATDNMAWKRADKWKEGINYIRLDPPQPTASGPYRTEVIEFFIYGCPHCRDAEPILEKWSRTRPHDVVLVRVPVIWQERTRHYARFFYTLKALDRLDLHDPYYEAVHLSETLGHGNLSKFEDQQTFAVAHGVSAERFAQIYRSEAVSKAVDDAADMTLAYKIQATPTMAVQGTYTCTTGQLSGGFEELMKLVDSLTAMVRKH